MRRTWLVIPLTLAAVGALWLADRGELAPLQQALGLKPASVERATAKPICSTPVNPNVAAPTDCIPAYLANLPPDPGEAGKLTLEGIDSDKDGVRDDVQRYIAENFGESAIAVKTLTTLATNKLLAVRVADSLGREETLKLARGKISRDVDCYSRTVPEEIRFSMATERVFAVVMNTPERLHRAQLFNSLLHGASFTLDADVPSVTELCGFDPATFPN